MSEDELLLEERLELDEDLELDDDLKLLHPPARAIASLADQMRAIESNAIANVFLMEPIFRC